MDYINDLSLVNPSQLVNDENNNKPVLELKNNLDYVLNYLNGNKILLNGVFGNLWDYNISRKRILINGGKFDSFRKCNVWNALNSYTVSNDMEIGYDEANSRCVYKGWSTNTTNREKWIENSIWIPEILRGQQLYFSIKAAGCSDSLNWSESNSVYETLAIQVLGGKEDVNTFQTVGKWSNYSYYANSSYSPSMTTIHIPFQTNATTKNVKIKIYRTVNAGYLHIDKVYVGGIVAPYDNAVESYQLTNIDINELFDYYNGITKVISTNVLGHKVPESFSKVKGADIITYDILNAYLREWMINAATTGTTGTTGTSGTPILDPVLDPSKAITALDVPATPTEPSPTVYPDIFGYTSDY
jgi:hypothetical protein